MALANEGRPPRTIPMDPVREFTGDHRRLTMTLLEELKVEREQQAAMLVQGGAKDFAEYRNRCGVIEGLESAIAICERVQRQL